MLPGGFLGILVDKITELASSIEGRLIHASSDFEVATWDVSRLRAILLEVKNEASEPESKLYNASEAKRDDLHVLIESFRPLLEDLEKLVAKDQGLKKKRIWKRDKDNAAALDHIHRQLELRSQKVDFHLSTLRNRQLSRVEKKLKNFMEELRWSGGELSPRATSVEGETEADIHFSLLRHELAEIGITDVDIEAHKSTIKAILRERLPSYHEAQFGHSRAEPSEVSLGAALSRRSEPERHTPIKGESHTQEPSANKDDTRSAFQSDTAALNTGLNESKGMFYINDSTDSESEVLHHDMERVIPRSLSPHVEANMNTKASYPHQPRAAHSCCLCHQVFASSKKLEQHENEMHPRGFVWSCAAVKSYEAAYFDHKDFALLTLCGFCGQPFPKSAESGGTSRRDHLNNVHKWAICYREMQFYRADDFLVHLKLSHSAVWGWWLHELLRRIRRLHIEPNSNSLSCQRSGSPSSRPPANTSHESRRLSEPAIADDFGNFHYKNLLILEKANKDIINKLRAEAMQAQARASTSAAVITNDTHDTSTPGSPLKGSPLLPGRLRKTLSLNKELRSASHSDPQGSNSSPHRPPQPSSPLPVQFSTDQNHEGRRTSAHEDRGSYHDGMMPRSPSSMSRKSSMHRIHSDVSEYDAQGNLIRRTITDSYSSLPDTAAISSERHYSSPGPQRHWLSDVAEKDATLPIHLDKYQPAVDHIPTKYFLFCQFCPEAPRFNQPDSLAHHLRTSHPTVVTSPGHFQKHRKLKQAYKKRTRQLYKALQSLRQETRKTKNADGEGSRVTDFITDTLRELELDSQPSNSDYADHDDDADTDLSGWGADDGDWEEYSPKSAHSDVVVHRGLSLGPVDEGWEGNLSPPAPQSMMSQFSSKMSSNTQKKHKCKVCDKQFTRPSSLQTHMYSHTDKKPHACTVEGCGRHFSLVSNLRRHKKVRHGESVFIHSDDDD